VTLPWAGVACAVRTSSLYVSIFVRIAHATAATGFIPLPLSLHPGYLTLVTATALVGVDCSAFLVGVRTQTLAGGRQSIPAGRRCRLFLSRRAEVLCLFKCDDALSAEKIELVVHKKILLDGRLALR
jgi:hypothetical protein